MCPMPAILKLQIGGLDRCKINPKFYVINRVVKPLTTYLMCSVHATICPPLGIQNTNLLPSVGNQRPANIYLATVIITHT